MHTALNLPYAYDYITKYGRKQAEVIWNLKMNMFALQDKVKPGTEYIRCLNLAVVKLTTVQVTRAVVA
jgi:hypothetical protein